MFKIKSDNKLRWFLGKMKRVMFLNSRKIKCLLVLGLILGVGEMMVYSTSEAVVVHRSSLPVGLGGGCAVYSPTEHKIYVFGGTIWSGPTPYDNLYSDAIYEYDVTANSWSQVGTLPYKIAATSAALGGNGKIYLAPGIGPTENNGWGIHSKLIEFDPITRSATETVDFGFTVWNSTLVAYQGNIYIFGGWTGSKVDTIWKFEPSIQKLTELSTKLVKGSNGISGLLGTDGLIYLFNGYPSGVVQIFNPVDNTIKVSSSFDQIFQNAPAWRNSANIFFIGIENKIYEFNPITETLGTSNIDIGPAMETLPGAIAVMVSDKDMFFIGGWENGTITKNVWELTEDIVCLVDDDFESYEIGKFPSGSWYERYNGSGQNVTDTAHAHSGTKAFRLRGMSNWSVCIENHNAPWRADASVMGYEFYVYPEGGEQAAGFYDYYPLWGAGIACIEFDNDGYINTSGTNSKIPLASYTPNRWYKVKVEIYRAEGKYQIWVDNIDQGVYEFSIDEAHSYTDAFFQIGSGHAGNYGWFDDVKVWYTNAQSPLQIINLSLPSGQAGIYYQATLTATGGISPYTWLISSGQLPAGLTLDTTTGIISGTPTQSGSFTFTAQVSDSVGSSTSKELSIYIASHPVIGSVTVYDAFGNFIGTYTTIQAGVNDCPTGGTVSVSAGTYTEAVYINKRIALIGVGTPTITASGLGETNTVTFDGNNTDNAIISGFIITGATGNTLDGNGIYCKNGADSTIANNTISENMGCGILCSFSSPTITNNTISGNRWYGIYCHSSSPTIINNTISRNGYDGIFCYFSSPTITNNTISGSSESGIYCSAYTSPTIINNTISGNNNGILCYSSTSPTIINNTISGNGWRGIDCSYSSPSITNNTISRNGWGLFCHSSSPTTTNNIISGNRVYGIYCENSSSPTIYNNIITENGTTSSSYYGIYVSSGTPTINYDCVWGNGLGGNNNYAGCSAGPHDISANPQFIAGVDFHLSSTSPCIDKGLNTAPSIPTTDKDGNPRIVNGIVDMGAYEYQGTQPLTITTTSIPSGQVNTYYQSTLTATGGTPPYMWFYSGNLPLGLTLASNTGLISGTPTQSGSFTFTAQVTDSVGSNASKELSIYIASPPVVGSVTVYDASGNFIGTYTTIQAGVDACPTGGTVSVLAGTYTEAVYINKRIALIGAGSNSTTITAAGLSNTNTVTFDGTVTNGAIISGFIISGATSTTWPYGVEIYCKNGAEPTIYNNTTISGNSCGIFCDSSSPTITNNTISGNRNNHGISCYNSSSPIITNNTISGNGNGILCNYYSSPTICNNTISENRVCSISCYNSSSPTIYNNTILGSGQSGIVCTHFSSPTIYNNTITISGNSAHGILNSDSSSPTITNNTISGNTTAGIYCSNSSPIITNNTISRNGYYGILNSDSSPTITNNIITENGSTSIFYSCGIYVSYGTPTINYNCVWGNGYGGNHNYYNWSAGANDISANPLFIGGGDYHLQPSSPCINAGSNTTPSIPSTDKDGNPRIVNDIVDIGAYEYQGTQPLTITSTYLSFGQVNTYYQATLTLTGGTPPYNWSYSGNLPSGLTLAVNTGLISGTPTQSGSFTFTAQVTDQVGSTTSKQFTIIILPLPYGYISGKITESDGKTPISGAVVGALQGTVTIGTTTTNANGSYTITFSPGTYTISVSKPQYLSTQITGVIVGQSTTTYLNFILYSARIKPTVSSPQSAGSEVLLKIQAGDENEPVEGLFTLFGTLTYAPAEGLEILQVTPGEFMGNDLQLFVIDKSNGKIQFMMRRKTGAGGVSDYGDVLAIKFKIADTAPLGTVTFSLSDIQAYGTNSQWISLLPESTEMRINRVIIKPVVYPPILPDHEFEVGIQVGDENNPVTESKSFSFDLNWEALEIVDVLKPVSENVEPGQFLGTSAISFATLNNGTLSICVGRSVGESSGYGTVAKIRCRVLSGVKPGTKGTFTISNVLAYGANSNQIKLIPVNCTFTIEVPGTWTQVWPGDTDNSGDVNKWDIIPIAFYLYKTGAQRETTSFDFRGWPAVYWNIREAPLPDAVYADTNGDGVVNIQDVHAVIINMGKTHSVAKSLLAKASINEQSQFDMYAEILKNRPDLVEKVKYVLGSLNKSYETQEMRGLLQELIESVQVPEFKVYPNPYRPTDTHKGIRGITFENLGNTWQIKIYNIAGELVEEMYGSENDYIWLTAKELASGVYIYVINSTTLSKKTGKLAIIK